MNVLAVVIEKLLNERSPIRSGRRFRPFSCNRDYFGAQVVAPGCSAPRLESVTASCHLIGHARITVRIDDLPAAASESPHRFALASLDDRQIQLLRRSHCWPEFRRRPSPRLGRDRKESGRRSRRSAWYGSLDFGCLNAGGAEKLISPTPVLVIHDRIRPRSSRCRSCAPAPSSRAKPYSLA